MVLDTLTHPTHACALSSSFLFVLACAVFCNPPILAQERAATRPPGEVLLPGLEPWLCAKPAAPVENQTRKDSRPDELRRAAMNRGGDAARGKTLFASEKLKCAVCHKVRGEGGDA